MQHFFHVIILCSFTPFSANSASRNGWGMSLKSERRLLAMIAARHTETVVQLSILLLLQCGEEFSQKIKKIKGTKKQKENNKMQMSSHSQSSGAVQQSPRSMNFSLFVSALVRWCKLTFYCIINKNTTWAGGRSTESRVLAQKRGGKSEGEVLINKMSTKAFPQLRALEGEEGRYSNKRVGSKWLQAMRYANSVKVEKSHKFPILCICIWVAFWGAWEADKIAGVFLHWDECKAAKKNSF